MDVKLYTLNEAAQVINYRKKRRKQKATYYLIQRLSGAALIICSLLLITILGEITTSLFLFLFGAYVVFTREPLLYGRERERFYGR